MSGVIDVIRRKVAQTALTLGKLSKQGCEVNLLDVPQPRVTIDMDLPGAPSGRSQTRCDYLLLAEASQHKVWVVPIEIKNSKFKVSGIVRQIRAGARVGERLVDKRNVGHFRPVAVVRGPVRRAQLGELRNKRNRVVLHGQAEPARIIYCGDLLTIALRR